ncbi:recombinase family protein [Salimicrobium salexigens]|uniref:Site-specific DNA recombinase n=1 Tax=Salimicrobium salexigens TaxID=908941 RepID=A0ABY1KQN4_9BACI|nr:recombinase family protein [Salimicrobium salexigens]SIS65894.1 Site-specific DNA recombinase [Salimicrobium salexigens]
MEHRKYGYIYTDNNERNNNEQITGLKKKNIQERDIFTDVNTDESVRKDNYELLKRILYPGDVLYLYSLDHLGRSKEEIMQEWHTVTKELEVDVVVLDMPLLDTTKYKDSMGTFIADLVSQMLSWMAKNDYDESELQKEEESEVNNSYKRLGRPKAEITDAFLEAYNEWKSGNITATQAMKQAEVKKTTFYKLVRQVEDDM